MTVRLRRTLALLTVLLLAAAPAPLAAQQGGRGARLELALPQSVGGRIPAEPPRIAVANVLDDADMRELVRNGFPAQLHFRLELWRVGGWFNDLERTVEWDVIVAYDPAAQSYRVRRRYGNQTEDMGSFATLASAQQTLERPFRVPLLPGRSGRRYYYNLVLDVEALSVSDLDQLERWLRGELRPAVRGRNNPVNAVGNGLRTLVSRVLGGERRHYEQRSGTFRTA